MNDAADIVARALGAIAASAVLGTLDAARGAIVGLEATELDMHGPAFAAGDGSS